MTIADRRQLLAGLTGTALALSAPVAGKGPALAPAGVQHSMRPCRFGAIHYRYAEPARARGKTPVLCLHASPASSIGFTPFLSLMGTDRLAIAPDNPGFGLSDRPPAPSTIADFAGAIWDLVDDLRIRKVDLIGSNTGSATAVEMARQRPDAVRHVVLHGAPMFTPAEVARYKTRLAGTVPLDFDAAAVGLSERWKSFTPFRQGLSDEIAWQLFWEMNRDPLHKGWGHDAAFAYDFPDGLRQLRQPVLVLNPDDDLHTVSSRAAGIAPNIQVRDLTWSGYLFTTHAAEVAALVRAFVDG